LKSADAGLRGGELGRPGALGNIARQNQQVASMLAHVFFQRLQDLRLLCAEVRIGYLHDGAHALGAPRNPGAVRYGFCSGGPLLAMVYQVVACRLVTLPGIAGFPC